MSATKRLAVLEKQLTTAYHRPASQRLDPDDIVIVSALRTPITRASKVKGADAVDLLVPVFRAVLQQTKVEPQAIGDVVIGSVLGPSSQRATEVRMAALLAGIPESVPARTVNRQCSSGLQAVADVAAAIKAEYYTIGLAGGVETMSAHKMTWEGQPNAAATTHPTASRCLMPMGITSENVAAHFKVRRRTQDEFAVNSHKKAAAAQVAGKFKDEIVPIAPNTAAADDGIRPGATLEDLSKLSAVFKKDGTTTAGNASQVSDGAAAVLLMTRQEAQRRALTPLGTFRSYAVVGVDPAIMGVGPVAAIPAAVSKAGLTLQDVSLFEVNEAFASQACYSVSKLGLDPAKVNVNGGAIALGHPLGATGARCVATLLHEMKRNPSTQRFGVVSMCIGTGMGAAAVFESN